MRPAFGIRDRRKASHAHRFQSKNVARMNRPTAPYDGTNAAYPPTLWHNYGSIPRSNIVPSHRLTSQCLTRIIWNTARALYYARNNVSIAYLSSPPFASGEPKAHFRINVPSTHPCPVRLNVGQLAMHVRSMNKSRTYQNDGGARE